MQVTRIDPPKRFGVIIAGGREAAARAIAERIPDHIPGSRPMANAHVNGYGAVHCDVWVDSGDVLEAWFSDTHDRGPGALLFFIAK